MENASKALIIAGAILISILLISVGIMIFNSSSGLFSSAQTSMSDQEKTMFNQGFTMYEGKKATATTVKELIRKVNANNADPENAIITISSATNPVRATKAPTTPYGTDNLPDNSTPIANGYQYTVVCEYEAGVVCNIVITKTN